MTEIKMTLTDPRSYTAALHAASMLMDGPNETTLCLDSLRGMILDQLPRMTEPQAFGSVVRAGYNGNPDRVLWQRDPLKGHHYWESESGVIEVWSELTDVEVLRVGLGEDSEAFNDGMREMNAAIHQKVRSLLAEAITGERKNAYEKAIQAVEELAP